MKRIDSNPYNFRCKVAAYLVSVLLTSSLFGLLVLAPYFSGQSVQQVFRPAVILTAAFSPLVVLGSLVFRLYFKARDVDITANTTNTDIAVYIITSSCVIHPYLIIAYWIIFDVTYS